LIACGELLAVAAIILSLLAHHQHGFAKREHAQAWVKS